MKYIFLLFLLIPQFALAQQSTANPSIFPTNTNQSQSDPTIFNTNGSTNQSQANPDIFQSNGTGGSGTGGQAGGTDGSGTGGAVKIPNPLGEDSTLNTLFAALINIVLIFAIPIVVLFIIYAGFLYVTAQGNQEQISKAHKALLYAVIGGVLILGANVLISVISETVETISG